MSSTGLECQAHPGEHYTNFCTSPTCMHPLCPECIDDHVNMHKLEKSHSEVTSIQSVKQGCYRKLRTAITILEEELNRPSSLYITDYNKFADLQLYQIEKYKQKIIDQVTLHCNGLLEQLNSQNRSISQNAVVVIQTIQSVREQLLAFEQSLQIFNDYRKVDPLSKSREQRNTEESALEMVRKILQLDVKSLLDQLQANMKKETKNILNIYFNEAQCDDFSQLLSKMIILSEQFNEDFIHQSNHIHQTNQIHLSNHIPQSNNQSYQFKDEQRMPSPINHSETDNYNQRSFISQKSFTEDALEFERQYQFRQTKQISQQAPKPNHSPIRETQLQKSIPQVQISMPAFFHHNSSRRQLHFFKANEKLLYLYDLLNLPQAGKAFQTVQLNIDFNIPSFHRSIVTPHGDLYLLGGSDQKKLSEIYFYEPISKKMLPSGNLVVPRSSFGVCYIHPYIYSVSGFSQQSQLTPQCERYHVISAKSERITDCIYIANAPTLVPFNQEYIYKFGANSDDGGHQHTIERYVISENRWEEVQFHSTVTRFSGFIQFGSGCQINKSQMIVFGGYDFQNAGYDFTYLIEVSEQWLTVSETYKLPQKEGFWNNQAICWHLSKENQVIVALQNVQVGEISGTEDVNESKRSVIMLERTGWKYLIR